MLMSTSRSITPDEIAAFKKDGVVLLRNILTLQAVNKIRGAIDRTLEATNNSASYYNFTQISMLIENNDSDSLHSISSGQHPIQALARYICDDGSPILRDPKFNDNDGNGAYHVDSGLSSRDADFRRVVQTNGFGEIAGLLMESKQVRFYDDQVFIKEPGCLERTAFHQDAPYFHASGSQMCVFWVPVDPVTPETGMMTYVRGSHRWGKTFKPNVFITRTPMPGADEELLPDIESDPDSFDLITFSCEPGDIVVHHFNTVHGTSGNHSRHQMRRAASLRYAGDDIRYMHRPAAPRQLHHKAHHIDGDLLSHIDFPVIWTRSAQSLAA